MIKAAIFDLGDTLIRFEQADLNQAFVQGAKNTYQYLAEMKLALPNFNKYCKYQLRAIRWEYFKSKITGKEFDSTDIIRKCLKKLNINVPQNEDIFTELAWLWYQPLTKQSYKEPDAIETLQTLQNKGLKLAIVSNTFIAASSLDKHLEIEGLIKFFPIRIYSCDIGIRKPNKEIFNQAINKLNIPPHNAIFIGDKFKIDIKGARKAGMYAILKSNSESDKKYRLDEKSFRITKLIEIPPIIDKINKQLQN